MDGSARSTITIPAPRHFVMTVIADFSAYPAWASMHSVEIIGELGADGRARLVRFDVNAGIFREQLVLQYEWNGDELVRWQLAAPGPVVSAMSGSYLLADRGERTDVTFELAISARFPLPGMLRRRAEQMVIDTALGSLRSRVLALR
ncbi:MAG TPA: SRPBCC family protein [Streptosporangiaceae bacterium]|nr:SRPBCC family protein [Streptosporangiaceae bacterium]